MSIFDWIKDLFGKEEDPKPQPKPKPTPKPKPKPEKPKEEESSRDEEPSKSKAKGEVTTFLWKPDADYVGNNPVVLAGCDDIRSQDLKMEILGRKNRPLKVEIKNTGRANRLGYMKYGRIHFRPQRSVSQFKRSAPLKIRFYHTFTGKKKYVKVRGKDQIVVKHVDKRKDLK